jgi:low temperature requirement protein LtrA
MTWYEFLLFVHLSAAVIWVGAGFLLVVLAIRADQTDDEAQIKRILDDNTWLATHLFIPSSLTVFAAGMLLTIDGPWKFDQLRIVLGLLGYAATFLTGVTILRPRGDRIAAMIARDGGMTPGSLAETRRLLALARIDYVVLFLVIADMAIKPTGDDVALLLVMAAILAAGLTWAITRAQAVTAPGQAPA